MDQNRTAVRRPTGITVTAWVWIAAGGLMFFSSLMGAAAYSMMLKAGAMPPLENADMPGGFAVMAIVFQYFGVLLLVQGIVAAFATVAGICLLRLQAWARTALEILSWLGLVYCIGFGSFWVYSWVSMTAQISGDRPPVDPAWIQIGGAAMGLFMMALFAVPFGIMIYYLRGKEARTAVSYAR